MKDIPVLYENDEILVINKPKSLSVQGGEGVKVSLDKILPLKTLGSIPAAAVQRPSAFDTSIDDDDDLPF